MSKNITVTIHHQKRKGKDQPYSVTIAIPRKEPYTLKQRYARRFTAKRGALRNLSGIYSYTKDVYFVRSNSGKETRIEFVYIYPYKSKKK